MRRLAAGSYAARAGCGRAAVAGSCEEGSRPEEVAGHDGSLPEEVAAGAGIGWERVAEWLWSVEGGVSP
ncbi:hypothetical protein GUJ93_ZPchr0014g47370 [Zizania palustris]|uniref:Uncharacterized protein n=1 Tax=Zizania palustris TaxID=103762 RepID=A0A8J5W5K7_ZIZPA|nr:hypothetical protein GUJ93_ZPchr0014g47370 [Zizania palustris]